MDKLVRSTSCEIDGNPDLYGFGIRVGFYMQTIGSFLSAWEHHKESHEFESSNLWFQLALFIALCVNSVNNTVHPSELFIVSNLLYILIWFEGYIGVIYVKDLLVEREKREVDETASDVSNSRFETYSTTSIATLIRIENGGQPLLLLPKFFILNICLWFALMIYQTWFWWHGIESLPPSPCGDMAFFFSKVEIHGWFRWLNRVVNILHLITIATGCLIFSASAVFFFLWLHEIYHTWHQSFARLRRWVVHSIILTSSDSSSQSFDMHDLSTLTRPPIEPEPRESQPQLPNLLREPQASASPGEPQPLGDDPSMQISAGHPASDNSPLQPSAMNESSQSTGNIAPAKPMPATSATLRRPFNQASSSLQTDNESSRSIQSSEPAREPFIIRHLNIQGFACFLALIAYCILAIELSIRWNRLQGVDHNLSSAGQLIPFIVGIGTLCQGIWKRSKHFWRVKLSRQLERQTAADEHTI